MKKVLVFAAALVLVPVLASAQGRERDVPAPTKKVEKQNPRAAAEARLTNWVNRKLECYRSTGAIEGTHWRQNPRDAGDIETHSSIWRLAPEITGKVADCKKMKAD